MHVARLMQLAVALAVLSGCSGKIVVLKNDQGETVKCEVSQSVALWFGVVARDLTLDDCVAKYEKAGFKKIS